MVRKYIAKAREKTTKFHREFRKHAVTAMIAAFGFLIALSWRDVITGYVGKIENISPLNGEVISAVIITIISVIGILIVTKIFSNKE